MSNPYNTKINWWYILDAPIFFFTALLFFFLSPLLWSGSGSEAFSQCTLTANPVLVNVSCNGANNGSASANAGSGTAPYTYLWSNGQTTASISNLAPGNYSVAVIDASCIISGVELVTNGDFSAGNTGFSSGYAYTPPPNTGEGQYWVATGPQVNTWNGGMFSLGDHTTGSGNFMLVNGSGTPGSNVWCQTITVTPNTTYNFSTWVSSLNNSSPALLQFSINSIPLGPVFNAPATWGSWIQFFSVWNSGASTSATICIVNQNTTLGGNDFGLDDISFQSCLPCTVTASVTITEPPVLAIVTGSTTNEFCNRADGTATISAAGGSGSYTYLWNPSAQITSTATGLAAGNYSVTVTDANGCTRDTMLVVNFTPGPTANAGADASICSGFSTSLTASGGGTYAWLPATGLSNASIPNPIAFPTSTTTYTITVTDANNCSASDDVTVTVYQPPVASFTFTSVCFNNPTVFTDMSTGNVAQWAWSFGDGSIDSVQNPSHTYNTSGTFVTLLIVTTPEGCNDTMGMTITVDPLPSVNFSSTTVCINNATCFTDLTTISSGAITAWSWNFDDPNSGPNNISNSQNPCHTYTAAGTYNVVLTVTSNNNCQSTTILQTIVLSPPVAAFTAPDVCLNTPTFFTDGSSGGVTQWYWAFGDGGISNSQNPSHTYLGYGTYIVMLIVASGGTCMDTITDTVIVNSIPVVNFISDTVCLGDSTTFSDVSFIPFGNITAWNWNFGDGNFSSSQNTSHAYSSAGNFNVTLTAISNNNCSGSNVLPVLVYPLPVADFSSAPSPSGELTDVIAFNDLSTGGVVQWIWDFGDSTLDSVQFPSHVYSDTGAYIVTLVVVSSDGCVDTVQHSFEIKDYAFYIPNTFTPNDDGRNDFFFGTGMGITEYELSIFDRWGNMIFYCKINDLPQTLPCRWDGKVRGASAETAQQDVYVWKARFTNVFKKDFTYVGNVSVVR